MSCASWQFPALDTEQLKTAWNKQILPKLRELDVSVDWPAVASTNGLQVALFQAALKIVSEIFANCKTSHASMKAIPFEERQENYLRLKINAIAITLLERMEVHDKKRAKLLERHEKYVAAKEALIVDFHDSLPSPRESRERRNPQRPRQLPFTPRTQAAVDLLALEFEMFLLNRSIAHVQNSLRVCSEKITSIIALLLEIQRRLVENFRRLDAAKLKSFREMEEISAWLVPTMLNFLEAVSAATASG